MDEIRKSDSGPPEFSPKSGVISERLHDIVMLSRDFERHVGQALMVNSTDLAAMEHLMTAGPLTPSELSRRLDISTAATTLVVDRLVALKHVQRHPHAHDRRKVVVVPEPGSVEKAFTELMPVIGGVAALEAAMPEADRAVIEAFLGRVVAIYTTALEPTRSGI
ncbi:MarR family winged helix-turn-helix transcriptional regulator [Cryobacterium frigoriphilum]|nr:MarR family transcriptional regulator [Cryobacterium frigoriphilum]